MQKTSLYHRADSSIKLLDLHTTQTQTSEVRWAGHWAVNSVFAQVSPKKTSHRQLKKTSNVRVPNLINIDATNPIQIQNLHALF